MNKQFPKIELTANILIIVAALLVGGVVVKKYFFVTPDVSNQQARLEPKIGSKINMADVNWANQSKTLILALRKGCHFCTESAPFYERLSKNAQDKNIKLVAVLPGDQEESAAYLKELGITNLEIKQLTLDNLQVSGTPTLILANDKGEITNFWIGKLPPDKEVEVINQLQ